MNKLKYVMPEVIMSSHSLNLSTAFLQSTGAGVSGDYSVQLDDISGFRNSLLGVSSASVGTVNVNLINDSTLQLTFGDNFISQGTSILQCTDSRCILPQTALPAGKYNFNDLDSVGGPFAGACGLVAGGTVSGNCEIVNENTVTCEANYNGDITDIFQCDEAGSNRSISVQVTLTKL